MGHLFVTCPIVPIQRELLQIYPAPPRRPSSFLTFSESPIRWKPFVSCTGPSKLEAPNLQAASHWHNISCNCVEPISHDADSAGKGGALFVWRVPASYSILMCSRILIATYLSSSVFHPSASPASFSPRILAHCICRSIILSEI